LEKRKEHAEEIEDIGRRGPWRLIFYSQYKIPLVWGNSKIVLGGFGGFI